MPKMKQAEAQLRISRITKKRIEEKSKTEIRIFSTISFYVLYFVNKRSFSFKSISSESTNHSFNNGENE